jgi:3'(2'), 5'-bisphosphate nucleotidase
VSKLGGQPLLRHKGGMTDLELLDLAAGLARRAGAAIMAVRRAGFAVDHKADYSPVTEADCVAEALIVEGLRAATPDIPVVAEEEVAGGLVTAAAPSFWLVDPLDGTKEFAKGLDEFAVCIGLVRDAAPVLGVLMLPATGELFGGIVGPRGPGIAWKEAAEGAPRQPIKTRAVPAEGWLVLDSRSHSRPEALAPLLAGRKVASIQPMGSAAKFARLAEGMADCSPRPGPTTMEWDTAAGQAIIEAAGGAILTEAGTPLRYGKAGWRNVGFIALGRVE